MAVDFDFSAKIGYNPAVSTAKTIWAFVWGFTALALLVALSEPAQAEDSQSPVRIHVLSKHEDSLKVLVTYPHQDRIRTSLRSSSLDTAIFKYLNPILRTKKITAKLNKFKSDACTLFPSGSWGHCCLAHDLEYWVGGTHKQRKQADKNLKTCAAEVAGSALGVILYLGVRLGGNADFPTPWKWGFGWNYDRAYVPLSDEEVSFAYERLEADKVEAPIAQEDFR